MMGTAKIQTQLCLYQMLTLKQQITKFSHISQQEGASQLLQLLYRDH